jgi:hypothetical protein
MFVGADISPGSATRDFERLARWGSEKRRRREICALREDIRAAVEFRSLQPERRLVRWFFRSVYS